MNTPKLDTRHYFKQSGQVFTPASIVKLMLDFCGYSGKSILKKHVIDNSCGNGAFLYVIVERYIKTFISVYSDKNVLRQELQTFIHGIEIDKKAYTICLYNLDGLVSSFGIDPVDWDIRLCDALDVVDFDGKMDFVVGNPPYVRVHNLDDTYDSVKRFHFANGGMTDLYLAFYELGFRMMKKNSGKMCYITPSSWFNSMAANNMRKYLQKSRNMVGLIDFGHHQLFEGVTSYVTVAFFDNRTLSDSFGYYEYDSMTNTPILVDYLSYRYISLSDCFYFGKKKDLAMLHDIKMSCWPKYVSVKNGYATLSDKIFISLDLPFSEHTIPVLKGSTGKWSRAFFPYDDKGKPLPKDVIFSNENIAGYMEKNKSELLKGKTETDHPDWYLYGRTQALKDTFCDKIGINALIKEISSIKLQKVPAGSGLYSGLYIQTHVPFEAIEDALKSNDFIDYLKIIKKYKSGGYYTYNSKDLEQYLNYKLTKNGFIHQRYKTVRQSTFSSSNSKFI